MLIVMKTSKTQTTIFNSLQPSSLVLNLSINNTLKPLVAQNKQGRYNAI
jgi:hypothetical protein